MVVIDRFTSKDSDYKSKSNIITNKVLKYVENGFLLLLTFSIYAAPYITSKIYDQYLQAFTMVFIIIQSYIKARDVLAQTDGFKSKSSIIKLVAFIGAFVVAMIGFKDLNLNGTTEKLWTALSLSNLSYGISDAITNGSNLTDLIANGLSALLLLSGGVALYFKKNIMGICCMLTLLIKSLKGFISTKIQVQPKHTFWYTLLFASLSLIVIGYCYINNVHLEVPKLFDMFSKNEINAK